MAFSPEGVDLSTSVGGIRLASPLFNASGVWCSNIEEIAEVLESPFTGAVVSKSCTPSSRLGNPSPRYSGILAGNGELSSINSMGLPNEGLAYYMEASNVVDHSKPFFMSLSGLSREDNLSMLRTLQNSDARHVSGVELNLSCPNVAGKPQVGYDFEAMSETLRQTFEVFDALPLGVKLPPYFDVVHWDQVSDILRGFEQLKWITCINSIGNGLVIDWQSETTLIAPKGGLGGLGGALVKATALANVRSFRERLPDRIDVIGCGGVLKGSDAFEHILCGASAVQIGTLVRENGVGEFERVHNELVQVMRSKNYQSLIDFKGKLKSRQPSAQ
jgi:dihydroorotate dehydrogenase (fumarate)